MKTRWVRIESLTPMYLVISEAEMSTVPVSLMESDISEASLAGRKPVELENADLLFCSNLSMIVKAQLVR